MRAELEFESDRSSGGSDDRDSMSVSGNHVGYRSAPDKPGELTGAPDDCSRDDQLVGL